MGKGQVFVHAVWATLQRRPLIVSTVEKALHHAIGSKCHEHRCGVLAIGGTDDHVHMLVRLYSTISIARLIGEVKGFSSYLMTHDLGLFFQWQTSYYATSVTPDDVPIVTRYIRNQRTHHAHAQLLADLEPPEA